MVNPVAELRTDKLHMATVENVLPGANAECTLFDQDGPGNVASLWMALGTTSAPSLDGRLRVYYDHSQTPAIDIDVGTLFATHFGAGQAQGSHSCTHMHVEINPAWGNETGLLMTFPMPFGEHIRVAYYCPPSNQQPSVYSMIAYSLTDTDEAEGKRLRCSGARWADQSVWRNADQFISLADVQGGPGSIVYHAYVGGLDARNDSWLERNFSFYIDGEKEPSIVASGTEDWFDSAWYFSGWRDYNTSFHSYVGTHKPSQWPNAAGMVTDLWSKWGGIPFQDSVAMYADTEWMCTTGDRFSWAVLYYQ